MKFLRHFLAFAVLLTTAGALTAQTSAQRSVVDIPQYRIAPGKDARLFAYTNRMSAFYCGVLNGPPSSGFHGITQAKRKIFENYWIRLGDSLLDPSTADIEITPAGFVRRYPLHNTEEHVSFADSLTLLAVAVKTDYRGDVTVYPGWSADWNQAVEAVSAGMYGLRDSVLATAAFVQGMQGSWEVVRSREVAALRNPAPMYLNACYMGRCTGVWHFTVEFAPAATMLKPRTPPELFNIMKRKEVAISDYLASLGFTCSDSATMEAFAWIAASMRALVMQQHGRGIYAGLPWFDDYWGRDTFIALPGALLVTGRFEEAREVLASFYERMDSDSSSATYGRIPNRVQPGDVIYNTVDGTPRLVIQTMEYVRVSNDTAFLRRVYPDIRRTVKGALRHTDSHGFLTHADAETWMDAVGPEGPWSPRGNRAIDIQALWHGQLLAAAEAADVLGLPGDAAMYRERADALKVAFQEYFFDQSRHKLLSPEDQRQPMFFGGNIHDHLNVSGEADNSLRPNVLFTLTEGALLDGMDDSRKQQIFGELLSRLTYPWGVASLDQHDENFHPYHEAARFYPKDAAYHNGTVWTWLSGAAIDVLTRYGAADSAWVLTRSLQHYAMESGAIGTIPENTDALPRAGNAWPRWSGTFSQAWSDAEYLRSMYRDYLGLRPRYSSTGCELILDPHLPSALTDIGATTRFGDNRVRVRYVREPDASITATLSHIDGNDIISLHVDNPSPALLKPGESLSLQFHENAGASGEIFRSEFHFASPRDTEGIATLQPPPWPRIPPAVATARGDKVQLLCKTVDPPGDDTGMNQQYRYPLSSVFRPGSFDLRDFSVTADADNVYFTIRMQALSQPGWHPEYGFQLTMLAIAIDQSHDSSVQSMQIGHNSGYFLKNGGYDRLILVGGGVRMLDAKGKIITEFVPETTADAFGDAATGVIHFAIPRVYLGGAFDHWRYTVVAGAQDDHGGAGIGEFRDVGPDATEWSGGGATQEGVNWYDDLHCP